jgi:hypothetical protein
LLLVCVLLTHATILIPSKGKTISSTQFIKGKQEFFVAGMEMCDTIHFALLLLNLSHTLSLYYFRAGNITELRNCDAFDNSMAGRIVLIPRDACGMLADQMAHLCFLSNCTAVIFETRFVSGFASVAG